MHVRQLAVAALALLAVSCGALSDNKECRGKCDGFGVPVGERHVQMIHVDGFRPDVFRALLDKGMLPHFQYLLSRGKVSYNASTVDKSETMKVIQSYLTGRIDTHVVGWWQFNRSDYRFRNYWLDPAEVVNYAVGLEFPVYPTVLDLLANERENLTAGMSLARRGIPFNNYGRPYLEGFKATTEHTYYNQAHATAKSLIDVYKRIGQNREPAPKMSMLLLAPADEFAHALGVTTDERGEHCFEKGSGHVDDTIFEILDNDEDNELGGHLEKLYDDYFTDVDTTFFTGSVDKICFDGVELPVYAAAGNGGLGPQSTESIRPEYILGMMVVDMELGYLINAQRSMRFDDDGNISEWKPPGDLAERMANDEPENTLFDRTLFLIFGDHGMVDTKTMMAADDGNPSRAPGSDDRGFIDYLNGELGLTSAAGEDAIAADAELGIDFSSMPNRLAMPHKFPSWQSSEVAALSGEAEQFSSAFFAQIKDALRSELHEKYWWLFFLKKAIVDPRLDDTLDPVEQTAVDAMAQMYLRSEPAYRAAEVGANRALYDSNVRLVYGGGARNNAELFIPSGCGTGTCTWDRRPSLDEILGYRDLVGALQRHPAVGLIFIRENNEQFAKGAALPATMNVRVIDRSGNSGRITVHRDAATRQLVYGYRVDDGSDGDPLGYQELGSRDGLTGTYNEWIDRNVAAGSYYHNAVAGIGSYLYSSNPAIGDVLVTHSQGWNFGANAGGHGGVHRGEKLTVMIASGPEITPGELKSIGRWQSKGDSVVPAVAEHNPTILDAAPTALAYLGYDPQNALPDFAKSGAFAAYLDDWVAEQRSDILDNLGGVASLQDALSDAGLDGLEIDQFRERLERLLQFAFEKAPELPDFSGAQMDGNVLKLQ